MICPHCNKPLSEAAIMLADVLDMSGCILVPPCHFPSPRGAAWPDDQDDDDDGTDEPIPKTPLVPQEAA